MDTLMDEELLNRHRNINRGFRSLEIWQLAIGLYEIVHRIVHKNADVPFKVKAQIEDSALSISSNIAEGYSRRTPKENLRFYEIALSSAAECYSQMYALTAAEQINQDDFDCFDTKIYELENKLISMNRSLIIKIRSGAEWKSEY
jgi:four helix bundle protein